jgi:hypothetical protein
MHRGGDIGVRWGGDEYLRIALNLATPTLLGVVAGRNAEIIAAFDWAALDEQIDITPDQRFDPAIAAPPGSSYDLARTLVGLADAELYRAKHSSSRSDEPRIAQVDVRIVDGRLINA